MISDACYMVYENMLLFMGITRIVSVWTQLDMYKEILIFTMNGMKANKEQVDWTDILIVQTQQPSVNVLIMRVWNWTISLKKQLQAVMLSECIHNQRW
jgi:hypothetical protein